MQSRKGFTLVELMIVVLILGALASMAIPRIMVGAGPAMINACKTNVGMMNRQIDLYYTNEGVWPSALIDVTKDPNYLPEGVPKCPLETAYNYDTTLHRIPEHSH